MKLIDKDALVAEIERLSDIISQGMFTDESRLGIEYFKERVLSFLDTLEVKEIGVDLGDPKGGRSEKHIIDTKTLEVKEVDLEKLGEIARHLIAVKENTEDMRLDSSEWNLLKRIGYPERFKAQKGE